MIGTLEGFRKYAVVEGDGEDGVLTTCLTAARGYLRGAGVDEAKCAERGADAELYEIALYRIALAWYDNRGALPKDDGAFAGVNGIILQLREV